MFIVSTVAVTARQKEWRENSHSQGGRYGVKRPNSTLASRRAQLATRVKAFMLLGGKCEVCGNNDLRVLELDHVHNNGANERRTYGRGHTMIKEVFKRPEDFQLLCANDHRIKHS